MHFQKVKKRLGELNTIHTLKESDQELYNILLRYLCENGDRLKYILQINYDSIKKCLKVKMKYHDESWKYDIKL